MKWSTSFAAALALAGPSYAAPAWQGTTTYTDADILNYALTLEHLEDKFYREGIANYSKAAFAAAGFNATFYQNLLEVSYDETTHVNFLTTALKAAGAPAVAECTYKFGTTTAAGFVALASVLEGVGVTAYLGAAAYISTKAYLTAAASILTVESRHNAYLRASLMQSPFPQPFDAPQDFNQVYTLASQFIVSCPHTNPPSLPFVAFPALSVTAPAAHVKILTNSTITLTYAATPKVNIAVNTSAVYAAFAAVTGPVFVPAKYVGDRMYSIMVPAGIHGESYVVLTNNRTDASDTKIIAGPAIVEVSGSTGYPLS